MIHQRKILKAIAYAILLCFTSLTGAQPLYAVPGNNHTPSINTPGAGVTVTPNGEILNIHQTGQTAVNKWNDFSIGADATVNFTGTVDGFNSFNYVKDGPVSEIYGQLNAIGGNIFIANPAGVQIGNSAQINVGSLYVTNRELEQSHLDAIAGKNTAAAIGDYLRTNGTIANPAAELMSLGSITSATSVTFDGSRIVLDTDRIFTEQNGEQTKVDDTALADILTVKTTDADKVVLGYATDDFSDTQEFRITADGKPEDVTRYMWVETLEQLRSMGDNLNGRYALRNSIDANSTLGEHFAPIGSEGENKEFTGRFDGLGHTIFGLTVDTTQSNGASDSAGLFGRTKDAHIRNFTLNGGSVTGGSDTGSAVGHAEGGFIENITNTFKVSGVTNTGGLVGYADNVTMSGLVNTGEVAGSAGGRQNTESDTGGIVGRMKGGSIGGETYNLGNVSGNYDVGGIAGHVTGGAKIGNEATEEAKASEETPEPFVIYNSLGVTGQYNVGGIVGNMEGGSSVKNAANYGKVKAEGYTKDKYQYHTADDGTPKKDENGNSVQDPLDGATYDEATGIATIEVKVANAGGIVGNASSSSITGVINEGDVTSAKSELVDGTEYYTAGNVGGVAGRAKNTHITDAENKGTTITGAHNVGGIAGYFGGNGEINGGLNNGGNITATGARKYDDTGFARERVRALWEYGNEIFNIGNIGGIAGYVYGDSAKVKNSGNQGIVHSEYVKDRTKPSDVQTTAKAANVGGGVGKLDTAKISDDDKNAIRSGNYDSASVSDSYNAGAVEGYTGVGGIVGMMYNGSVANSYNSGTLRSTRQATAGKVDPLNMGGIVGDTTEQTDASAFIYNVDNTGTIGDDEFFFYGRHVGGIVGRLSGEVEKASNMGDIYNGYGTVGGIAGWWYKGSIKNAFNTGNITVVNNDQENAISQVGGIVGAYGGGDGVQSELSLAYNLGTIRSFSPYKFKINEQGVATNEQVRNTIGGIIGRVQNTGLTIDDVYTTNNLYAATANNVNKYSSNSNGLGAIVGEGGDKATITDAYYVKLHDDNNFKDLSNTAGITATISQENSDATGSYDTNDTNKGNGFVFDNENFQSGWRIYTGEDGRLGTTPILNAFLPSAQKHLDSLSDTQLEEHGIAQGGIQYGTAVDPMFTFIKADGDGMVKLNWENLGGTGASNFAVFDGSLTIDKCALGDGYYRGIIYADRDLILKGTQGGAFRLSSDSELYGANVTIDTSGETALYGKITSTNGNINITGNDVEVTGELIAAATGKETKINSINRDHADTLDTTNIDDPNSAVQSVSEAHAISETSETSGSISVTGKKSAEILYGHLGTGHVSTAGNFTVKSGEEQDGALKGGSVYVDADLLGVTGGVELEAGGEVLLDLTNTAKANAAEDDPHGSDALHEFMGNYRKDGGKSITLDSAADDAIVAIDVWDGTEFDLNMYDTDDETFGKALLAMNNDIAGKTYLWIDGIEQLSRISTANKEILGFHLALKDDIDATGYENYEAIDGFKGAFDGRGFRIVNLQVGDESTPSLNAGVFSELKEDGEVRDLSIVASKFYGTNSAGAVSGINNGSIKRVTTLGNHVEATGSDTSTELSDGNGSTVRVGAAGGIAGVNHGYIQGTTASDSVIAGGDGTNSDAYAAAGGIVGINTEKGIIGDADIKGSRDAADSAVTANSVNTYALGGIVGVNLAGGNVTLVDSLGVTSGKYGNMDYADANVGGIAGVNSGTMFSLYNESIVNGTHYVGGIAGRNTKGGTITAAINTTDVAAGGSYAGGIAGSNGGTIESGRNTGEIDAVNGTHVGGMVGENQSDGILKNLSNALTAAINGKMRVGGIAGTNSGTITSDNNLVNEGTVSGNQFVGGIAGVNRGTIENVKSDTLVLDADGNNPTYFGGIAGQNNGTITNATNDSSVEAEGATFVGGIVGENTVTGKLIGEFVNNGSVLGRSSVGGLVGKNSSENLLVGNTDENGEITRLQVTNNGTVEATDGTAAGIVYEHDGNIMHADLINTGEVKGNTGGTAGGGAEHGSGGLFGIVKEGSIISDAALINRGTVTVTEGDTSSTGGVIGINHGKITNSTLINETAGGEGGVVEGGENTGGLIGKNTGDITYSSLINRVGAEVSGTENVGGLIGYNIGKIEGGRKETENGKYYAYQIYNNGEVNGTNNVGGLIGHNADGGALYAGYNTGTVNGDDSVGGIAGRNDGSVSSVFNTIMTGLNEDGTTKYGAVTGKTNVGGIVGSNTGKLTNAYNTTAVESGGTKGNIAGSNSGEVENVYATNNDKNGMLIGTGNGTVTNGYNYDETKKDSASYEGFFEDGNDVWRIYEGYSTPLLRVFLTDAKYKGSTNQFTYNATMQGIKDLQNVTAADGLNGSQISSIAEVLLTALEQKNAGTDYLAFSSTQIAANNSEEGFNPNNLGYDIDATYTIKQAPLKITLKDIYRVYGDETMFADEDRTQEINYSDAFFYEGDGIRLNRDMLKELGDGNVYIEDESVTDKAVEGVSGEKKTNDAGDYLWSVIVKLADGIKKNYTFGAGEDDDSITVKGDGLSHVAKADLEVTLSDIERIYGNASITQGTYAVESDTLTNGDSGLKITDGVVITDNGLLSSEMTKDANNNTEPYYTWYVENTLNSFDGVKNLSNNYNLTLVNPGKSIVMKRALYIDDILGTIQYGSTGDFNLENGVGFKGIDEENMTGLLEGDSVSITVDDIVAREDGEYELNRTNGGNRATADVKWTNGEIDVYKDSLKALVMLSGDDKKNYYLADANENGQVTVNGDIKVTPQELYVTLDKVVRDYGNKDIKEGGYTVTDSFIQSLVNGDAFSKEDIVLSGIFDGALTGEEHGRVTYDVKEDNYKWYATGIDKEHTSERLYSNYKILIGEDVTGESVLDKAVLTLTPNDATTTYGTAFDENSYSYTLSGITNDDEENALRTAIGVLEYGNDAAFYGEGGKYTADAATHNNAVYIKNLNEKTLTNYNVVGDKGAAIITKATLDVALNPVERTYGDTTLTHGDYSINTDWLDKLVNGDELMYTGDEISISGIISDKAVIDEYTTNDAGGHSWSAKVNTSALAQNYNINKIAIGSSIVNKAKLIVNAGHAETTYGTPFDKNKYYYDLVGVTNGDAESEIKAQIGNVAYDNTAAIEDGGDRVTDNAGVNGVLSILTDLFGIELGNYEIEKVNDGTATVEKADLFITAHDKHTHVGREPEYTGTTLGELELVNGDTLADFSYTFGIEEASMLDEAGHYAGTIAAVVDGQYYYDGTHDWSAHHDVFANYKVNVEAGNLTVVRLMPTIPHYNYSWLYDDAPYGRKWNFRERKAEIYFQDGGMAYDENM